MATAQWGWHLRQWTQWGARWKRWGSDERSWLLVAMGQSLAMATVMSTWVQLHRWLHLAGPKVRPRLSANERRSPSLIAGSAPRLSANGRRSSSLTAGAARAKFHRWLHLPDLKVQPCFPDNGRILCT